MPTQSKTESDDADGEDSLSKPRQLEEVEVTAQVQMLLEARKDQAIREVTQQHQVQP